MDTAVLDNMDDYRDIINFFKQMTNEQLEKYFTTLSDEAWKLTTPAEWQAYIMYLPSKDFKGIVDYMTVDEILWVWQFFTEEMTAKFFSGLSK